MSMIAVHGHVCSLTCSQFSLLALLMMQRSASRGQRDKGACSQGALVLDCVLLLIFLMEVVHPTLFQRKVSSD